MSREHSEIAARQTVLCQAYLDHPEQAITLKRVRTVHDPKSDPLHGKVIAPQYPERSWDYGIDAKVGGLDDLPNPGHLLCATLAACLDSTIRMIADRLGVGVENLEVEVTGDVDVRGCLMMDPSVRPGFRQLRCDVLLSTDPAADPRLVRVVRKEAERLCVTLDTLRRGVPVTVSFDPAPDARSTSDASPPAPLSPH